MSVDVAVIGGGVSGLAAAYELVRYGHRVTVVERQVHPGGSAVSERLAGFLMEHGPSTVNAASNEAVGLSRRLGLDGVRCELGPGVRRRYLVRDGVLRGVPTHALGFLTSSYLSPAARLRIVAEALMPASAVERERTVAEFFGRRFGHEFVERVVDPLVGGLFAGAAAELSVDAVFPRLMEMERHGGSITREVLKRRLRGRKMPTRRLFSWHHGVATLPRALAWRLGPGVRTGIAVRRIRPRAYGFRIDAGPAGGFDARAVVVATQPHVAAALLEGLDEHAAEAAGAIDAPPLAVVFLGYRRQQVGHPLDGLGYLAPTVEDRALSGALFCSTMFPGRAPRGHVAVAGYVGGARKPELARLHAGELVALAREEFRDLVGTDGEPVVARVRQWARGLPQYRLGHDARAQTLREAEQRRPGLFLTGNYFAGPSVATCVAEARATARRAHALLRARPTPAEAAGGALRDDGAA